MPLTTCHNGRVSLDRGNDPGLEFMFMLTDAVADTSLYKVMVAVRDPRTSSDTALSKTFRLEIEKSQASSEVPQDEVNTSHSITLKANSTIATVSCIIAMVVLMFASRIL